MPFPEIERVIYGTNLIDEVICQFRFPPILKIESVPPADFQDRVRDRYPLYRVKANIPLMPGVPEGLASKLKGLPFGPTLKVHEFASKDENWILSLAAESIALACRKYKNWEQFKDYFQEPLTALQKFYRPAFVSRVGLRYRDLIQRSKVGLADVLWSDLLQPWIAGPYGSTLTVDDLERSVHQYIIKLPEHNARVLVNTGMVDQSGEQCCVLDADFFTEQQTELADAISRIDFFNKQARYFWRWSIKERLHTALGPQPVHPSP
jgi:uncharacterized protein (TIGR04255 family)